METRLLSTGRKLKELGISTAREIPDVRVLDQSARELQSPEMRQAPEMRQTPEPLFDA